ncbi:MAG: hypothetical protein PUB98_00535 [Clostridiales bacterium]|nr:hypothetical protein [Clostridiales bacterium]
MKDIKQQNAFFTYVSSFGQKEVFEKIWNTPLGMLSGGERAKLFFSMLTYPDREWYICDDPFAGVDSGGKRFRIEIVKGLEEKGKGIILTTHETEPLESFGRMQVLEIKDGSIQR